MTVSLKNWLNAGLAFFYPEICQLCGGARATPAQGYVCASCRRKVRYIQPPYCERCGRPFQGAISRAFECAACKETELFFATARSAVVARDPVLEVIHKYKYNRALWFEPFLVELLLERAVSQLTQGTWDGIVPVPLHPSKQREREFNQAERLARELSRATGIPLETKVLRRIQPTRTQTQLSREERLANVRRAFALTRDADLSGRRFVLIDDVMTTGATTNACARVLRDANAGDVCVWTVARGI